MRDTVITIAACLSIASIVTLYAATVGPELVRAWRERRR